VRVKLFKWNLRTNEYEFIGSGDAPSNPESCRRYQTGFSVQPNIVTQPVAHTYPDENGFITTYGDIFKYELDLPGMDFLLSKAYEHPKA